MKVIKTIRKALDAKMESKERGEGTIVCTDKEFDKVLDQFKGALVSPGTAAQLLGVSRSYVNQLEREGKIRAYRIERDNVNWDGLPLRWKPLISVKDVYIYIPEEDIEKIRSEMIQKAKNKIKQLKAKK